MAPFVVFTQVVFSPLLVGSLLGVDALAGLLAGAIASSIQLAISASNRWPAATDYFGSLRNAQVLARPP